ncbi:MAG: AbrB/MazE/SpoVT family DNA-binding domain-containing protein [Caulobacteraceae bacterium]
MAKTTKTTTVSTKGQVILPKAIRDELKWSEGTQLVVERADEGVLLKEASVFAPTKPGAAFGMLKYKGKAKTLKEMDAAIAAEVRRRHARGRY